MTDRKENDTLEPGAYSAFVLDEDGTWQQPTFHVPEGRSEADVEAALYATFGRKTVCVCAIAEDSDAPPDNVRDLEWEP